MENKVECKGCSSPFIYSPGPSGNARQLCDTCRQKADAEEIERLKDETILEGNKYLVRDQYDCVEILNGNFPAFENDAQRYVCAVEFGRFIKRCGFGGKEENVAAFLKHLGSLHLLVCVKQWPLVAFEQAAQHKAFIDIIQDAMSIYL